MHPKSILQAEVEDVFLVLSIVFIQYHEQQ